MGSGQWTSAVWTSYVWKNPVLLHALILTWTTHFQPLTFAWTFILSSTYVSPVLFHLHSSHFFFLYFPTYTKKKPPSSPFLLFYPDSLDFTSSSFKCIQKYMWLIQAAKQRWDTWLSLVPALGSAWLFLVICLLTSLSSCQVSTLTKSHVKLHFIYKFSYKSQFHIKYNSQLYFEFRNNFSWNLTYNRRLYFELPSVQGMIDKYGSVLIITHMLSEISERFRQCPPNPRHFSLDSFIDMSTEYDLIFAGGMSLFFLLGTFLHVAYRRNYRLLGCRSPRRRRSFPQHPRSRGRSPHQGFILPYSARALSISFGPDEQDRHFQCRQPC